jgi:hypothetical protein
MVVAFGGPMRPRRHLPTTLLLYESTDRPIDERLINPILSYPTNEIPNAQWPRRPLLLPHSLAISTNDRTE